MGRKDFMQALADAPTAQLPPEVSNVRGGEDDGTVTFDITLTGPDGPISFSVEAMVPEVSAYPRSHHYFVYSVSDNTPQYINDALQGQAFKGLGLLPMIDDLAYNLRRAANSPTEVGMEDPEADSEDMDQDSEIDDTFGAAQPYPLDSRAIQHELEGETPSAKLSRDRVQRIKKDLARAKDAGFRISSAGNILFVGPCFAVISIRIAKLGIQEDTLRAWHLHPGHYFLLVIYYSQGYKTMDEILNNRHHGVAFTTRLSPSYRISLQEAASLFAETSQGEPATTTTKDIFIGAPLKELLNSRLLDLIQYRREYGFHWQGAENYFNDHQGKLLGPEPVDANHKYYAAQEVASSHLPPLVTADQLLHSTKTHSLPLIAMQYSLRHLVHCTKFCLVCHSKLENTFEALKPYVCSKALCLYQYMSLGFGPSIEHEICAQPNVVDLLISFCYSAANARALKELPVGLGLVLPQSYEQILLNPLMMPQTVTSTKARKLGERCEFLLDEPTSKLIYQGSRPLAEIAETSQWVELHGVEIQPQHRLVTSIFRDTLSVGPAVLADPRVGAIEAKKTPNPGDDNDSASCQKRVHAEAWATSFDELDTERRSLAILALLRLLPPVTEMKAFLETGTSSTQQLRKWKERIPPAALSVLRWIISSNRSCIVEVESTDPNLPPSEPSVQGLGKEYLQFRFAQGAPDKEQRFTDAVKSNAAQRGSIYPAIFAWHGSSLSNWHGIVREGLNYDRVANGRAYGDGVYHSLQLAVSAGYSLRQNLHADWPCSKLGITSALCLNEIVNSPDEFKSIYPHLVVQYTDWIQTRYLFVSCKLPQKVQRKEPSEILGQDPAFQLIGTSVDKKGRAIPIKIPATAITRSRRPAGRESSSIGGIFQTSPPRQAASVSEEAWESEDTCDEDVELTQSDLERRAAAAASRTSFEPGQLKAESLPLFAAPSFATSQATKALQREMRRALATQDQEPPHELGWHLDPELVDNMYQWIVELHSFDRTLPLGRDLEELGAQSVVLELRFGAEFPYSPPWIRVIRPRFLPRMVGGGGHVTAGGAMCMELLTNSGWNPASSVEAVLLQVRMAISSTDPPARLDRGGAQGDYSPGEAMQAYIRACRAHGWTPPEDFMRFGIS